MVRSKKNREQKAREQNQRAGGGPLANGYVHNDEFRNPMDVVEQQRLAEKEMNSNMCRTRIWREIPLFFVFVVVVGFAINYHLQLHKTNACEMTFIYRPMIFLPIVVRGNSVKKYTLFRYLEGVGDQNSVRDMDIPVLFIPGSGGSGKQVRSVATTIANITAASGIKSNSRFVFYAVDFDDEFSFLSGATLMRQREFVVNSIETIIHSYSAVGVTKVLLIGHSFGGTVLYSLPAHPKMNPKWMDLVITLGAPINGPPLLPDYYMQKFFDNTIKAWHTRAEELEHVTLISYSGGIKDFMVPDNLASSPYKYTKNMEAIARPRDGRVIYRPSWSVKDVACAVDHNCLAWCNQLLRHISNLSIKYASEYKSPKAGAIKGSRQMVTEFFESRSSEGEIRARQDKRPLFHSSLYLDTDNRTVRMSEKFPYVLIDLDVVEYDIVVYIRTKAIKCRDGVIAKHAELTFRSTENFTTYGTQEGEWMHMRVMAAFSETQQLKGVVRIGGTPHCQYRVESDFEVIGTHYRRLLDSTTLPYVFFYTLFLFALIPVVRLNKVPSLIEPYCKNCPKLSNKAVLVAGVSLIISFVYTFRPLLERTTVHFIIWMIGARFVTFLISRPLQPFVGLISRFVERRSDHVRRFFRLIFSLLAMYMASFNLALGYAFVLFLTLFKVGPHSKNGLMLIAFSIAILVSIGFAGNVRDGSSGIFHRSMRGLNPNGYEQEFINIIYEYRHPLLIPFIITLLAFLLNLSQLLSVFDRSSKELVLAMHYSFLLMSLATLWTLESMAVVTGFYFVLFETMKEHKGLKAADGLQID